MYARDGGVLRQSWIFLVMATSPHLQSGYGILWLLCRILARILVQDLSIGWPLLGYLWGVIPTPNRICMAVEGSGPLRRLGRFAGLRPFDGTWVESCKVLYLPFKLST